MNVRDTYDQIQRDPVGMFRQHANPASSSFLAALPDYMRPGLVRYILFGLVPGAFLRAVLSDEPEIAEKRADDTNRLFIDRYRDFLAMEAPEACWGSSDKVRAWVERGGLIGKEEVAA